MNIFEQASRMKLRFKTDVGPLSADELWDLPLSKPTGNSINNLNALAVDLNRQLKATEESFVDDTKRDAVLQLRFDVVKHIIDVRKAENSAKTEAKQKESQRAKLDELIAQKKGEALSGKSIEELEALRAAL